MKKTKKEETTNIQTEDVVEETKEHTNDTDKKADSSQLEKAPNKVTKDPEEVSNRIYKKIMVCKFCYYTIIDNRWIYVVYV